MLWKVEILERRLVLSVFYDYDVVAKVGDVTSASDAIASFVPETSVNDDGRVAFVANVTGANGAGTAVITGDAVNPLKRITFDSVTTGRKYSFPQIANDNQVLAAESISGSTFIRTWDSNAASPSNTIFVRDTDKIPGTTTPYDSVILPSRANDGGIGYIGLTSIGTELDYKKGGIAVSLASISGGGIRTMTGDGGRVVARSGTPGAQVIFALTAPNTGQTLASNPTFTAVSQPGISDDGMVIAFAGIMTGTNNATAGKGIYLSYFDGAHFVAPFKVAGIPNELGFDNNGAGIFLNDFDFSAVGGATLSNRVGVVHRSAGAAGIQDDVILVTFIATPSAAGWTNTHTNTPLLFSANKGIWTLKILPELPLYQANMPSGTVNFARRTSPMPVVQVGDSIGGRIVSDLFVFDPLATAARDQSGAVRGTIDNGDNYVVFRATTNAGDMVVRAAQLDTDSDGLYDHWERAGGGIDIDLNGTIDLNLNAMGANPMHKDLFLELDWLKPDAATRRNFAPETLALATFSNQFSSSPLTNPDGTNGVNVHIDAGAGLSRNMGAGSLQGGDLISHTGDGKHIHVVYFGKTDPLAPFPGQTDNIGRPLVSRSMEDVKKNFFSTTDQGAREVAFKYALLADHYGIRTDVNGAFVGLDGSTGLGEANTFGGGSTHSYVPGNDFLVTLAGIRGPANGRLTVPTPIAGAPATIPYLQGFFQSQTIAHELGHTLGLLHGGFNYKTSPPPGSGNYVATRYKPTYMSLMNYAYQLDPDTSGNLIQDYSGSADMIYDDWAHVTFSFNQYFDAVGGTPSFYSHGSDIVDPEETNDELQTTLDDLIARDGPLDAEPPILSIDSPAANANISSGSNLTVNLTASDNGGIASVNVSFDVNGDGTISPAETIDAAHTTGNNYQAIFNNVSGPAGQRTLTATAADASSFTIDQTLSLNVTTSASPPPKVTAAAFLYDTLPLKLTFTFSQDVQASLAAGDFFIRKIDGAGSIIPTLGAYSGNTQTLLLPGIIPDGRYIVTLSSAGISSAAGQLDGDANGTPGPDFNFNFLFATGDVDNDGQIGFSDLVIVAQNYGAGGTTASKGDLNYDGETGFADLVLVAQHYGTGLPAAALPAAASPFAAATPVSAKSTSSRSPASRRPAPQPARRPPVAAPVFHAPVKRRGARDWLVTS